MTRKSQLNTVDEVIHGFGGVKAMCDLFGGVPGRFSNHKAAGRFPDNMHMRIFVEATTRGLNIAPHLIGLTEDAMAIARGERQREFGLQAAE